MPYILIILAGDRAHPSEMVMGAAQMVRDFANQDLCAPCTLSELPKALDKLHNKHSHCEYQADEQSCHQ